MSPAVRIIAGLGNPGPSYDGTRHNVGFAVLDVLAASYGVPWAADRARKGLIAKGPGALLVKPQTYMNESGVCIGAFARYFRFSPEQVLVVYDDIALPVGNLRLRASGSAGGHNGMKSIIAHLGSESFPRLRVGIGTHGGKSLIAHVLGGFSPEERELINPAIERAAEAVRFLLAHDLSAAANRYNSPRQSAKTEVQSEREVRNSKAGGA